MENTSTVGRRLRQSSSPMSPVESATFRKRPAAIVTRTGVGVAGVEGQASLHTASPRTSGFSPSVEIPPTPKRTSLHMFQSPGAAERQSHEKAFAHATDRKSPIDHVEETNDTKLSFWQTHFCRPADKDAAKADKASNRRFSFLSIGSIISGTMLLVILFGVAAAVTAVTLKDSRKAVVVHRTSHNRTIPPPVTSGSSPIRAAIAANFPDPTFWLFNGTYYAFATNNAAGILDQPGNFTAYDDGASNIQMATSTNFVTWDLLSSTHDPLPTPGLWATQGLTAKAHHLPRANVWAPGINQRATDKKFVLYYAALKHSADNESISATIQGHPSPHCVGAAVSTGLDPAGPYEPLNETLACQIEQGGAIDPAGFEDKDGSLYVVYKIDGNNIGHGGVCGNTVEPIVSTPLMLQKMKEDGVTKDGSATQVLDRIDSDGPLIEAPALVRSREGVYFLFFSSGCTRAPSYDVKYATATKVEGPYTRAANPLLKTGDYGLTAPGSVGVHDDGKDGLNMVFHARVTERNTGGIRAMFTTKLVLKGHQASVARVT